MQLVIVQSINNFKTIEKYISPTSDILAINQTVMVELDKRGINYLSIEDIYSPDDYCRDNLNYFKELENFLTRLDKLSMNQAEFPYSYSGSGLYILIWLDNMKFLDQVIKIVRNKYKKIFIYSSNTPKKLSLDLIPFSGLRSSKRNSTVSLISERSENRIIQLIFHFIPVIFIKDEEGDRKTITILDLLKSFIVRVRSYIKRKFHLIVNSNKTYKYSFSKIAYIIQDGHEVQSLRKYLPKYKFLNPVNDFRKEVELEKPAFTLSKTISSAHKKFAEECFSCLGPYIKLVLDSYFNEVVARIPSFQKRYEQQIKDDLPDFLLLSIGSRDVFDSICCRIANIHNIPVYVFQHGGSIMFQYNAYLPYLETSKNFFKTLFINSKENIFWSINQKTKVLHSGSIDQYEKNLTLGVKKGRKKIMYCMGPDVESRHLLNYYSTSKKHYQSMDIISSIEKLNLFVDLKLHPTGELNSYFCYKELIKNNNYRNAKIIYGNFIESISKNYGLIIVDYLSTAAIKHILSLKIPVVYYDTEYNKLRISEPILKDLNERFYIAKSQEELEKFLSLFKSQELPSKWSESFIDKYVYPVNALNPGEEVAKYIVRNI